MGNSWLAHLQFDSSSSSPCSTGPSSPGIAQNTSNEGTHSGAGSAFSSRLDEVFPNGQILPTPNLRTFTFAELKAATTNFSRDRILGEGRFGTVFKGWIDEKTFAPTEAGSGMAIAVKKMILGPIWARFSVSREDPWIPCSSPDSQRRPLNPMKQVQWIPCSWPGSERRPFDPMKQVEWPERLQGREEWLSEVNILGSLSHPNIVRLLGHCWEDEEVLLVYEFMPRGSLENHLFSRGSAFRSLSWSIRLKIAIGAARGVSFLHSSERKTIYRSFRPSDILLDLNYNAKISNFGLARNGEDSHVEETCVMGGSGYEHPEDEPTGHLYVKSDVYNFGVVLLEMLSGMRAVDSRRPSWQHNLVVWAKPYLSGAREVLSRVMDQRLEGQYPSEGAVQAAQLILKCLGDDPRRRPSMSEVVETLEQISSKKINKFWSRFRP